MRLPLLYDSRQHERPLLQLRETIASPAAESVSMRYRFDVTATCGVEQLTMRSVELPRREIIEARRRRRGEKGVVLNDNDVEMMKTLLDGYPVISYMRIGKLIDIPWTHPRHHAL